jgi:uncharacterized phage-associated protein
MLNERKTAQIAAFFIRKEGGCLNILKLVKLLYLADREAMDKYDFPLTGDHFVSMPHGPVLSGTYDLINGASGPDSTWEQWISDRENHNVSLKEEQTDTALDELSRAEVSVLESVYQQFGQMSQWDLVKYTHDNCPEWRDPNGSSIPISYEDVFLALKRDVEESRARSRDLENENVVDRVFASL